MGAGSWVDTMRTAIQGIANAGQNEQSFYSIVCTVTSIDSATNTAVCTPIDGVTAPLSNVLMVADLTSAVIFVPSVGSQVVVTMLNPLVGYIALTGALDSVALNGTNLGALVIIDKLVTQMNNLENLLNDLIIDYNTHTHTVAAAPGTTATPLPEEKGSITQSTTADLIGNKTVQQGNGGN